MGETSQVNPEDQMTLCSHLQKATTVTFAYHSLVVGERHYLFCRACFGEILIQVLDYLRKIEVKVK